MTNQYPVLVYGTLRPGHGNYRSFLEGFTTSEQDVRLQGYDMYTHGGFPYLVDGEGEVTATLVHIDSDEYDEVLEGLDWLEGFRKEGSPSNHYDRKLHTFEHNGETVQAWTYICAANRQEDVRTNLFHIESGDWSEFVTNYRS